MSSRQTAHEALARDLGAAGLILDFDGTLSPIIDDPEASVLPEPARAALAALAPRLALLAVISGRPAEFLARQVTVPGVRLLGSYGIEQVTGGETRLDPAARAWLDPVREATAMLSPLEDAAPGIRVERKPISVAVHWRQAADHAAAAALVRDQTARAAAATGLRPEPGKLVCELRPPVDLDKGTAVRALLAAQPLTAVAYAGDDLGDIPAFRAVRDAAGYALLVDHGTETDPQLRDLADETFPGTDAFASWLSALAAADR